MKPSKAYLLFFALLLLCAHCRHIKRMDKSFDQICQLVEGKTASEVEDMLGPPDTRQEILVSDERWVWWNYTFLDGRDYAPEIRGQVVHLEITFRNPAAPGKERLPYSKWRAVTPYGVSYSGLLIPGSVDSSTQSPAHRVSSSRPSKRRPSQ